MHGSASETKNVSGSFIFNTLSRRRRVFFEEESEKASKEITRLAAQASYELPEDASFNLGLGECNACLCVCYVYNYHLLVCTLFYVIMYTNYY